MRRDKSANLKRSGRPAGARLLPCKDQCHYGAIATRRAMTLVEVIGGLALLATLLVGLLLANGRYTHQSALADRRLAAVHAADGLLTGWHQDPSALVCNGSGIFESNGELSWRTHLVDNASINQMGAQVVRLEIVDSHQAIMTSVEFVVDSGATKPIHLQQKTRKRAKP